VIFGAWIVGGGTLGCAHAWARVPSAAARTAVESALPKALRAHMWR
jgi:hypothetical protein